jgi:hypothetical protein
MKENTRRRENPETYGNEEKQRHDVCKNVGRGEAALMPKKRGGGKEAGASGGPWIVFFWSRCGSGSTSTDWFCA